MKHFIFKFLAVFFLSPLAFSKPVILPVQPDLLLSALPSAPSSGKLLASFASNEVMGSGEPVTIATRRYEIPFEDKSVDPPVLKTFFLKLVAMDVGSRSETVENFQSQLAITGQGAQDMRRVIDFGSGVRGVYRVVAEGSITCDALCGDRLALQMEMQGANEKEFASTFKALDLTKLADLARRLPTKLESSGRYTLFVVDELNPKKNRSYQVGTIDFSEEMRDLSTNPARP